MRITILGASGKVGLLLTKQLLGNGHEVTAIIHTKALPKIDSSNLRTVTGDVRSAADVKKAVAGSDIVVSTLGSWQTKNKRYCLNGF